MTTARQTSLLLRRREGAASVEMDAPASEVFAAITDVAALPRWNAHIRRVLDAPDGPLVEGAEWVVLMSAMGTTWPSRGRVLVLHPETFRFEHLSRSDDGNPSWAGWRWQVTPLGARRARLSVEWDINPRTFWRRALFARLRDRQLAEEVTTSLAVLAGTLSARRATA
jgi:uncharacterized protein YndB with AHSA1/START domain